MQRIVCNFTKTRTIVLRYFNYLQYSSSTNSFATDSVNENGLIKTNNSLAKAVKDKRYDLLERLVSINDPYDVQRGNIENNSSKEASPNLIPSDNEKRIVGCICATEMSSINWFELVKDVPTKCYCGYWFKLVDFDEYFAKTKFKADKYSRSAVEFNYT